MNPVETGGEGQVRSVVHDEPHLISHPPAELASVRKHLPGGSDLIAILQESTASGDQRFPCRAQGTVIGKARNIEDRVQPRKVELRHSQMLPNALASSSRSPQRVQS